MPRTKSATVEALETETADGCSSVFSRIGLFGLSQLEPVIIAALATEEPMLLIGAHGTGGRLTPQLLAPGFHS